MQRRQFLAGIGLAVLGGEQGWAEEAQRRKVSKLEGPPTVNPDDIPLPEGFSETTRARMEQRRWEILMAQRLQTLPFSEVARGAELAVYSRSVNQFTDVVFAGKTEWLGTNQGIKRVDHGRGELQLYTQEDGLPGNQVLSVVGEAHEAFALVWCLDGSVALCHLAPGQERWKVLFQRTKPPYSYERGGELRGRDRLVMNAEYVVFVCGARETRGEAAAPYYVYHRRRRKVTPALWDPSIRADHAFLGVTCAFLAKGKLWLGTSIGLIAVPLEPPKEPVVWERFLPERLILDGVALTPERLALQTASRGGDVGQELGTLLAFSITTRTPTPLPALPQPLGRVDLCAHQEVLYLLPSSGRGRELSSSVMALWTLAPKGSAWEQRTIVTNPIRPGVPQGMPLGMPAGSLPILADKKTLPDPVAAALLMRGEAFLSHLWLYRRFPHWLSPDATRLLPSSALNRTLPDPSDPDSLWQTSEGALVRVSKTGEIRERFPIERGEARQSLEVSRLFLGADRLLIAEREGMVCVPETGEVVPAVFGPPESRFGGRNLTPNVGAVAGPDQTVFVWDFTEPTLRYWDPEAQKLLSSTIPYRQSGYGLVGGTKEGLWQRTNSEFFFQAIGPKGYPKGEWERVKPDFSALSATSSPEFMGISGGYLWFRTYHDGRNSLVGWSPTTRTCTAEPEALRSAIYTFALPAPDGTLWMTQNSREVGLLCYIPQTNQWESVLPPEGKEFYGKVLIATEKVVWVLASTGFWRWSRTTKTWDRPSAAQRWPQVGGNWMDSVQSAPRTDGRYWIGSTTGLWVFDPERLTWEERTQAGRSTTRGWPLEVLLVTADSVWAKQGALLARLDRKSGKAHFYGRERGGPSREYLRLVEGDGTAWVLPSLSEPTLRYNPPTDRFEPIPTEASDPSWRAVASDPTDPQRAILAAPGYPTSLVLWDRRTRSSSPLKVPEKLGTIRDLYTQGGALYVAADGGLWRYAVAQGTWSLVWQGTTLDRFLPDSRDPTVFWASGQDAMVRVGGAPPARR